MPVQSTDEHEEVSAGGAGDTMVPETATTPSSDAAEVQSASDPSAAAVPLAPPPPLAPPAPKPASPPTERSVARFDQTESVYTQRGDDEAVEQTLPNPSQAIPLHAPPAASAEFASTSPSHAADEEELTEDTIQLYFGRMEDFKQQLSYTIHRSGPPFAVAEGHSLHQLLKFCVRMAETGKDTEYPQFVAFYQDFIGTAFQKILADDSVGSWSTEAHKQIYRRCEQALKLIAIKFPDDILGLLDLLGIILNPQCRFHQCNSTRASEKFPTIIFPPGRSTFVFAPHRHLGDTADGNEMKSEEDVIPPNIYARSFDSRSPRGYLVDFLNIFGQAGGFNNLKKRITENERPLTIPLLVAWLRPFGPCADYLAKRTVERYFWEIFEIVPHFLRSMSDEEFKKESGKQDGKNDPVTMILRSLRSLAKVLHEQSAVVNQHIEIARLSAIFKLLKVSTYNGKMHALNEINRIVQSLNYTHRPFAEEESALGSEKVAKWLQENHVLTIILADSMHQPQYVEKLEKIIRFMIKEKSLSLNDLDELWNAQNGKHEAIVKNVHDLLTKLAWDFTPEQLDHLFQHFQGSWVSASRRQREKLLDLIRRLAEDDKEGIMAIKVLELLWSLCHNEELPAEIMEIALNAHLKILEFVCSHDRDQLKMAWLKKCVEEIKENTWVVPALGHIKSICDQFPESMNNIGGITSRPHGASRVDAIMFLVNEHNIIDTVISSLEQYLDQVRFVFKNEHLPNFDPRTQDALKSKYSHYCHVESRLKLLHYILQNTHYCLPKPERLWGCLAENPVVELDRDLCFGWFDRLMSADQPDLEPSAIKPFYESKILQLSPSSLTEAGILCFSKFLRFVNVKEGKLELKRKSHYFLLQPDILGMEYLWKIILHCRDEIANFGIDLLRDLYAFPSQKLALNVVSLHSELISECIERLRTIYDNLNELKNDKEYHNKITQDANKAVRILKVIKEHVTQYDREYHFERARLPLNRATSGVGFFVTVKLLNPPRQFDDQELHTHTNETLGGLRRAITSKVRHLTGAPKLDLYFNNNEILPSMDRRLITEIGIVDHGRDRPVITARFSVVAFQDNLISESIVPSSPESSTDVSPSDTPQTAYSDETHPDLENQLPGLYIAKSPDTIPFIIRLADLGIRLGNRNLTEIARDLLGILPASDQILEAVYKSVLDPSIQFDAFFHCDYSSEVLYNLQVFQSLLLPAKQSQMEDAARFCKELITKRDFAQYLLDSLKRNNFLQNADVLTKQSSYRSILRMVKLFLSVMCMIGLDYVENPARQKASGNFMSRGFAEDSLPLIVAFGENFKNNMNDWGICRMSEKIKRLWQEGSMQLPSVDVCKALRHLVWTAASGSLNLLECPEEDASAALHKKTDFVDIADQEVALEALDCLLPSVALCPKCIEDMITAAGPNPQWFGFFNDMLFLCRNPVVRQSAFFHFRLLSLRIEKWPLDRYMLSSVFGNIQRVSRKHPEMCGEAFQLVANLLNKLNSTQSLQESTGEMLNSELQWFAECRRVCMEQGRQCIHDVLLEGHLVLLKELVRTVKPQNRKLLRTNISRPPLLKELLEDFLFPAARVLAKAACPGALVDDQGSPNWAHGDTVFDPAYSDPFALLELPHQARPICQTTIAITGAFDVIKELCMGSPANVRLLDETLTSLFYADAQPITEWEYSPPVGPRRTDGFVGLKNAGATCYMNSVLQQLFMIPNVRNGLLTIDGITSTYADEENDEKGGEGDSVPMELGPVLPFSGGDIMEMSGDASRPLVPAKAASVKDYNVGLIKHLQIIFSHLACSKLQFYIPRGFWKHFRLGNEPVNLREQHDALEFYNSVVDSVDEGLKSMKKMPFMSRILGGTFADQKICRDCPHRYSREVLFTALNVDIRNFHTLQDALELYVKGDLLEGANAYECEKCQRKVDAVKRMCIKKLPPILTIQLKRFDYDWEREQPIKFNDYFEFPREIDMEPYTAAGLAKSEGQEIPDDEDVMQAIEESLAKTPTKPQSTAVTKYRLVGIVVHSGQATGGHYYSYILDRDGLSKWYRFDDGDVTECKIDDDEEMKVQCFGGEHPQKRWWNAYILFYERCDQSVPMPKEHPGRMRLVSESIGSQVVHMIPPNLRSVIVKENLKFVHNRSQFFPEYFSFLRKFLQNAATVVSVPADQNRAQHPLAKWGLSFEEIEEFAVTVIEFLGKILFDVVFRTRRHLRGAVHEFTESFIKILQVTAVGRWHLSEQVLLKKHKRIFEYLVECPSQEIRSAVMRLLGHLIFYSRVDCPCPPSTLQAAYNVGYKFPQEITSLGDLILSCCVSLLEWKETGDNVRQLGQYFGMFHNLATSGAEQKEVLLRLRVPEIFIRLAVDDMPVSIFKHNFTNGENSKLYTTIAHLVRSIDFSEFSVSCNDVEALPNPYVDGQYAYTASHDLVQQLYMTNVFLKKLVEECLPMEEVRQMIKFLSWENSNFTARLLYTLLAALGAQYIQDLRTLLDFCFAFISLEDSWIIIRVDGFLTSRHIEQSEGFLSIMLRNRNLHPRRAYLYFKNLWRFLSSHLRTPQESVLAADLLARWQTSLDGELKLAVTMMCEWLQNEMESGHIRSSQYYPHSSSYYSTYNSSWNNQIISSNETGNGQYFERTMSARELLENTKEILPEDALMMVNNQAGSPPGDDEEETEEAISFNASADQQDLDGMPKLADSEGVSGTLVTSGYDPAEYNDNWSAADDATTIADSIATNLGDGCRVPVRRGYMGLNVQGPVSYNTRLDNSQGYSRRNGVAPTLLQSYDNLDRLHHITRTDNEEETELGGMLPLLDDMHIAEGSGRPSSPVDGSFAPKRQQHYG
ncbi:probable ubiquitin carboxyl-terminal hydrolase FAF-X [Paramacrobiotus metropolitanus]|uniref:probable ubiquitin carboxyl-terminal hydrolase FAF-X n=1 Tax=Paramacrobiotus metropolitanus TaxID=2943436 RepID=UPI0024465403|nr:probable ubiquitin carboxyl-terminal hydrolase FAF-X [Paramacrobiotus metropolitanus]